MSDYQVGLGEGVGERTQVVLNVLSYFLKGNVEPQPPWKAFQIMPFSMRLLIQIF